MSTENLYHKPNDEYATPSWIKHGLFPDWYDPCPLSQGLVERDGLNSDWFGHEKIFINPPYSNPLPWVEKAIQTSKIYRRTVVLLLKNDSSTKWYRILHEAGAHFVGIFERLTFKDKSAPFPSVLVILYPEHDFGGAFATDKSPKGGVGDAKHE